MCGGHQQSSCNIDREQTFTCVEVANNRPVTLIANKPLHVINRPVALIENKRLPVTMIENKRLPVTMIENKPLHVWRSPTIVR